MNPRVHEWISQFSTFRSLTDKTHCLYEDNPRSVYRLSMTRLACVFYLEQHPESAVPELDALTRTMCEVLVEQAQTSSHLFLLCGPNPGESTLQQVKFLYPRVREVEQAIDLFGFRSVVPMAVLLQAMGVDGEPQTLYRAERQRLRRAKRDQRLETLRERARAETCENAQTIKQLLKEIPPFVWRNFLSDICHAVRNTAPDAEWTLRLLVYGACPRPLHYKVEPCFQDRCNAFNGLKVLTAYAKLRA